MVGAGRLIWNDRATRYSFIFLLIVVLVGAFGPFITPYPPDESVYGPDGSLLLTEPPTAAHPLGTTNSGQDVLSRLIIGARPTIITGLLGGFVIISIGLSIGLISGYFGGRVDDVLMRITDFAYSIPLIPFAIVIVALLGIGFFEGILVIGLVLWRGSARVIRAQVLQIKKREYIQAARATGASRRRIIFRHILPNVAAMGILFFALGIGWAIIIQASLAFVGLVSPFVPSWGVMLRNSFNSGLISIAWWWSIPPGILISAVVLAAFMFSRGYERASDKAEDQEIVTETA
jgi:peptide/nickel transport system permease protein